MLMPSIFGENLFDDFLMIIFRSIPTRNCTKQRKNCTAEEPDM